MKINKIAATALVPVAVAGASVSGWALVQAATGQRPAARAAARQDPAVHQGYSGGQTADTLSVYRGTHLIVRKEAAWHRDQVLRQEQAKTRAHRVQARPSASHRAGSSSGSFSTMSAFERCVAWRESGNNPAASSAGLFGILPSTWGSLGYSGTAGQASVAQQMAAFNRLYAQYGTSPWAPYDGC